MYCMFLSKPQTERNKDGQNSLPCSGSHLFQPTGIVYSDWALRACKRASDSTWKPELLLSKGTDLFERVKEFDWMAERHDNSP